MSDPHIDCREAFAKLDDYVDRELSPEEMGLVKRHLERCQMCAEEFHFEEHVIACLRKKLTHIDLPEDLVARMLASLDEATR